MKKTIRIMLCIMLMAYCTLLAEEPAVVSIDTDADTLTVTQDAVLSIEAYEQLTSRYELYDLLKDGIKDISEGNTRPLSEAMSDIRSKRKR